MCLHMHKISHNKHFKESSKNFVMLPSKSIECQFRNIPVMKIHVWTLITWGIKKGSCFEMLFYLSWKQRRHQSAREIKQRTPGPSVSWLFMSVKMTILVFTKNNSNNFFSQRNYKLFRQTTWISLNTISTTCFGQNKCSQMPQGFWRTNWNKESTIIVFKSFYF